MPRTSHHTLHKHLTRIHTRALACKKGMNSNGKPVQVYPHVTPYPKYATYRLSLSVYQLSCDVFMTQRNLSGILFHPLPDFFAFIPNSLASTTATPLRLNFIQHKSLLSSNYSHFAYCRRWCVCRHPVMLKIGKEKTHGARFSVVRCCWSCSRARQAEKRVTKTTEHTELCG